MSPWGDGALYAGPDEWSFRPPDPALRRAGAGGGRGWTGSSSGTELPRADDGAPFGPGRPIPPWTSSCLLAGGVRARCSGRVNSLIIPYTPPSPPARDHLTAADWTEYGAHVRRRRAGGALPARFALGAPGDRRRESASTTIPRSRTGATTPGPSRPGGGARRLDPDYLHRRPRARGRAVRLVLFRRRGRGAGQATQGPIFDPLEGSGLRLPAQGPRRLVVEPARRRAASAASPRRQTVFVPQAKPILGSPRSALPLRRARGRTGPNVFPPTRSRRRWRLVPTVLPGLPTTATTLAHVCSGLWRAPMRSFGPPCHPKSHDAAHNPLSSHHRLAHATQTMQSWAFTRGPSRPVGHDGTSGRGANHETGHWPHGRIEGCPARRADPRCAGGLRPRAAGARDHASTGSSRATVIDRRVGSAAAVGSRLLRLFGITSVARDGGLAFVGAGVRRGRRHTPGEASSQEEAAPSSGRAADASVTPACRPRWRSPSPTPPGELSPRGDRSAGSRAAAAAARGRRPPPVACAGAGARARGRASARRPRSGRESLSLALSPRRVDLEPGERDRRAAAGRPSLYRIGAHRWRRKRGGIERGRSSRRPFAAPVP